MYSPHLFGRKNLRTRNAIGAKRERTLVLELIPVFVLSVLFFLVYQVGKLRRKK